MKLDNIIYDKDSLQSAIVEQWLRESPAFKAMYPSDTSTALTNVFASYGAMLQYMLVSAMANCYTDTAFSDRAIYQLATTLGNAIQGNTSSSVDVTIVKNNLVNLRTDIPKNSTFKINNVNFFNPRAIRFDAGYTTSAGVNLIQGEIITSTQITSGSPYERLYFSSDFKCNHNYITVKVNNEEWSVSDSFLQYDNTSLTSSDSTNVVVLKTDATGRSYIKFGDSRLGNLPPANSVVQIEYVSCDGEDGNINTTGVEGELTSKVTFLNQYNEEVALDVTVTTTSTAFGGANTQSIDVLRYSSPFIFASGHRAIRRQDYVAMLLNYCGYKTANVWGEYEEANMLGAYDAIMMNMVYYTGLKAFETYPYDTIGEINNKAVFNGELETAMGLVGSHSVKVTSKTDANYSFIVQDNDGKGFFFINDDNLDPRDSLLPLWSKASAGEVYVYTLRDNGVATPGDKYEIGDVLLLNGTDLEVTVMKVSDTLGEVLELKLNKNISDTELNLDTDTFGTTYVSGSMLGSGLRVRIISEGKLDSNIVTTNDEGNNERGIINAKSDMLDSLYYQSTKEPTLLAPVQIRFDFSKLNSGKSITGIKLKTPNAAVDYSSFVGTFAIYGTNVEPDYVNVRNSKDWVRVLDRTVVNDPGLNEWTDWFATNVLDNEKKCASYRYYVMEIYSTNYGSIDPERLVTIGKIKLQFAEDASTIYYDENGEMNIQLPVYGSAGPTGDEDGYLTSSLFDKEGLSLYKYNVTINGVTKQNGYNTDNLLLYRYAFNNEIVKFYVRVMDIDNQIFKIFLNRIPNTTLIGNNKLNTEQSLDTDILYSYRFYDGTDLIDDGFGGTGYHVGDTVYVDGSNQQLKLYIDRVNEQGEVLQVHWLENTDGNLAMAMNFNRSYDEQYPDSILTVVPATSEVTGTGLQLKLTSTAMSGNGTILGSGGKIAIESELNLEVAATFKGNRIDSKVVNRIDQPTITKYNHFTTYLEYKQPKIKQIDITVEISVSTSATISSTMILQEVSNNITHLFDIKPDSMGKGLKLSNIYSAVMDTPNVNWCKVIKPNDNIPAQQNELLVLSNLNVIEVHN